MMVKQTAMVIAVAVLATASLGTSAMGQGHSHSEAPHGGTLIDWGGGAYHVELALDPDAKSATVYILGDDAKTALPVDAESLLLTINDPVYQVDLMPLPLAGESRGKSSRFVGSHENLAMARELTGTISGMVDGTPYAGDFVATPGGHGPHDGMVASLFGLSDEKVGFVELKLHDDKGDLEAWLGKDRQMKTPIDIPADSTLVVTFNDLPEKTATLRVRDYQRNEDEDGNPNLRNGMTNYFIFPGDSGQDPSWLMGQDFKSEVQLSFSLGGKNYASDEFMLIPHTHADGHGHTH